MESKSLPTPPPAAPLWELWAANDPGRLVGVYANTQQVEDAERLCRRYAFQTQRMVAVGRALAGAR